MTAASPALPARQRILDTACRLFYGEGLRATGIDRIIAESGVAKMSFYRHFPSKNDLILAFLQLRHEAWMARFTAAVEAASATRPGLAALADALGNWFADADYRGCAFINAVAESGVPATPEVGAIAARHKAELRDWIAAYAGRCDLREPEQAADEAMLVVEGMIVRFQMTRDATIPAHGRRLLELIAAAHRG